MAIRKGLGRGLSALIPAGEEDKEKTAENKKRLEDNPEGSKKASSKTKIRNSKSSKSKGDNESIKAAPKSKAKSKNNISEEDLSVKIDEKDDLLDKAEEKVNGKLEESSYIMVKTTYVEPNRNQPRKNFDIDALEELAKSVSQVGIIQPILVRKKDDKYFEIIAGERRWRAAKIAKLKEVPVIVKEYTPKEIMEVALIENIQRQDLNPIEEAKAFDNLIKDFSITQDELSKRISKSRSQISNIMRLLKLPEEVQAMLIEGSISVGHARALIVMDKSEDQIKVAEEIKKYQLNVRDTEKLIKELLAPKPKKKEEINPAGAIVYKEMEKALESLIGSKVSIKSKNGQKGKVEIEYYSQEELERIFIAINKLK